MLLTLLLILAGKEAQAQRAIIAFDGVEIYSLPMLEEIPLAVLSQGDTVRVLGQRGEWVKVEFDQDKKGWMEVQVRRRVATAQERGVRIARDGEVRPRAFSTGPGSGSEVNPSSDMVRSAPTAIAGKHAYRRFGYTFGLGMLASDFTYNWKFIFHQTPRLAMEGSFKHAIGQAASSYLMMVNATYLLQQDPGFLPFVTGGVGVINTVPERSIAESSVSHMALNYGVGGRKHLRNKLSLLLSATQYTVFLGDGMSHFREFTVGVLVGQFWD